MAVLLPLTAYEKLSMVFEYLEGLQDKDIAQFVESLSKNQN